MNFIPIIGELLGLAAEAVEDKDKRNALQAKIMELQSTVTLAIVQSQTVPWVDALVKLLYALVALATPLGSLAMMGFNLYCKIKGVPLDVATEGATLGLFPAWATYRRLEKQRGKQINPERWVP